MEATGHRSVDMINYYDHSDEGAGTKVAVALAQQMFTGPRNTDSQNTDQSAPGVPRNPKAPEQCNRSAPESAPLKKTG